MEEIYKTIDVIFAKQRKARQENDYLTLVVNSEALLEYIKDIILYGVEQESKYRKYEAGIANETDEAGKKRTSSYAETVAKATGEYKEWQKAKLMTDLIYEMVNISKKLASSVNKEFNSYS